MDKHKDNGILLEKANAVEYGREVVEMAENDTELLNNVYREISEKLGMDTAMEIYRMFKVRFFNPVKIHQTIVQEYNGKNIRMLAIKYDYSEKTVRRIIKESLEK